MGKADVTLLVPGTSRNKEELVLPSAHIGDFLHTRPTLGKMGRMRLYVLIAFLRPPLSACFPSPCLMVTGGLVESYLLAIEPHTP